MVSRCMRLRDSKKSYKSLRKDKIPQFFLSMPKMADVKYNTEENVFTSTSLGHTYMRKEVKERRTHSRFVITYTRTLSFSFFIASLHLYIFLNSKLQDLISNKISLA